MIYRWKYALAVTRSTPVSKRLLIRPVRSTSSAAVTASNLVICDINTKNGAFWRHFSFPLLILLASVSGTSYARCAPDHIDEHVSIKYVHDGDTVILSDRRKLRIIGIDTPELATKKRAAEPLAEQAGEALRTLVRQHKQQLYLRFDSVRLDPYERMLAHAFLADGTNLSEHLLHNGLATILTLPPNVWQAECYLNAETSARRENKGIWALKSHQPITVGQLNKDHTGFHVVRNPVGDVKRTPKADYIYLSDTQNRTRLRIKIDAQDRVYFPKNLLNDLIGKKIEVRGIVHKHRNGFFMRLHHPVALQILSQ